MKKGHCLLFIAIFLLGREFDWQWVCDPLDFNPFPNDKF